MLIFKGEPNGRIAKELEKHPLVESKQVFAYWHTKVCNKADIMKKWVNAVLRRYAHFKLNKKNMVVIDDASMHKMPEIKRSVELSETKVMMIPRGLIDIFNLSMCQSTNHPKKKSEKSAMSIV